MDYQTPQFFRVTQYAADADRDVVDMVSGNPDWDQPAALREALREYADAPAERYQYPPSGGLTELRAEIAERRGVERARVVVTNGTCEANYLAMAGALERGAGNDVVLTDPVYPYYAGRVSLLGAEPRYVAVDDRGQLDPAAVREVASEETAAIVVNSPNNPTGAVYPPATVEALAEIAETHDAVLLSDEVYDHFDFTGSFESALACQSDNVVVTSGFSKSMAITGLRVGYAVFPPDGPAGSLLERARTRHMLTNIAASRPAQHAVLRALRETPPDYYETTRSMLRERVDAFTDALDAAGAAYTRPGGAFYVMARFADFPGTMANVERLVDEAGVAGMPGDAFGESRAEWLRFALVTPRATEAAERLADHFG